MIVVAYILALAGLVWGTIWMWRGSLWAGCLVYLLTACCFGYNFARFDVGGITLSIDRLCIALLVVALVVHWRLGRLQFRKPLPVDWIMFGFIGLLVLSVATHARQWGPNHPEQVVQHLLNGYLIPLALYIVAREMPFDERAARLTGWAIVLFGVYLAFTGICENFGLWALVAPRYIANPEVGTHFGRARGPMVHSVDYGMYLAACFTAMWIWRPRLGRVGQLAVLAVTPMFLAAIFFTKTRSVWLGAATGLILVLMFTLRGRLRIVILGSIVAAGVLVTVNEFDSILGLKREGTVADTRQSADMRKSFAYVSWKMFQDRPLTGFGFGQFAAAKLDYLSDQNTPLQLEEIRDYVHHNTFLSVLVDEGLIGLAIFLALYAGWLWCVWKLLRDPASPDWVRDQALFLLAVVGIAFWQMAAHEISYAPLANSLIFFAAGIVVALRQQQLATSGAARKEPVAAPALEAAPTPAPKHYAT